MLVYGPRTQSNELEVVPVHECRIKVVVPLAVVLVLDTPTEFLGLRPGCLDILSGRFSGVRQMLEGIDCTARPDMLKDVKRWYATLDASQHLEEGLGMVGKLLASDSQKELLDELAPDIVRASHTTLLIVHLERGHQADI